MKRQLLTLVATLVIGHALAQSNEGTKVRIGLKAGVNLAKIALTGNELPGDDKGSIKNIASFQFGAYADLPVSHFFSVQPGMTLNGKGGKLVSAYGIAKPPAETLNGSFRSNIMYLEVPVNAVFKIHHVFIGGGPYGAIAIAGRYYSEVTNSSTGNSTSQKGDLKFGEGQGNDYKRSDFGVNFVAGYLFNSKINIGISYGLGLKNISSSPDTYPYKNRLASITIGYAL